MATEQNYQAATNGQTLEKDFSNGKFPIVLFLRP
jgi:hypothetical protein